MATLLQIHADTIRETFEHTPQLLAQDRLKLFDLPSWADTFVAQFHSDVNRLGFILQIGYFQATHRFYPIGKFREDDARYVIDRFALDIEAEEVGAYTTSTQWDHQHLICRQLGFQRFTKEHKKQLEAEALRLGTIHMRPDDLFDYLICYLEERRIEIPSYHTFAAIITQALLKVERRWAIQLERLIKPEEKTGWISYSSQKLNRMKPLQPSPLQG